MIYVGIDVASEKHDFMILNNQKEQFQKHSMTIGNNISGYKKLHETIQKVCGANKDFDVRIGLESTGFYHFNLLNFLLDNNYKVMVINPILTKNDKNSHKVHNAKNDHIDALAICKYISDTETIFIPYTRQSYHIEMLKSLSRQRFSLVKQITKVKLGIYRLVTLIFPEFLAFFSNLYGDTSLNILAKYLSASKIARAHESTLETMIHGKCKAKASDIIKAAKNSVGLDNEIYNVELKHKIKMFRCLNDQLKDLNKLIEKEVKSADTKLMTIPGIGYITAASILGEIGDINHFSNPDHLTSFAGLDLEIYESGKYKATNLSISKKGSRYLRNALFQVSRVIWQNDKQFKDYYDKKKAEGKKYLVIIGHIEKKLIRVIYSVLKNNKDYICPQK